MTDERTDVTEQVEAPATFPTLPAIPPVTEVPRESAVDTRELAGRLLVDVTMLRPALAPWFARARITADQVEQIAGMRRRVAALADTVSRRELSRDATLDTQQALRIAERITGQALRAAQQAGAIRGPGSWDREDLPRATETVGGSLDRIIRMSDPSDSEFDDAVAAWRAGGAGDYRSFTAALAAGGVTEAVAQLRDVIARLAGAGKPVSEIAEVVDMSEAEVVELCDRLGVTLPAAPVVPAAVDAFAVLRDMLPALDGLAAAAGTVTRSDVSTLNRDVARDASAELWRVLVPLVGLRVELDRHARG